jgi:hypothetical protein
MAQIVQPPNVRNRNTKRKHWCFTLNNYTGAHIERLLRLQVTPNQNAPAPNDYIDYLIFGKEIGEEGTPHLQGFVSFHSRKRMNQVISLLGQCHLSLARDVTASIEYCKKDNDYTEVGKPPTKGKRNELESFKEAVKSMQQEGHIDVEKLTDDFTSVRAKYGTFFKEYINLHSPKEKVVDFDLEDWQRDIKQILDGEPDQRKIIFVVDEVGGRGKTHFARWYCSNNDRAQILVPGKKSDMSYALITSSRVVIFDCPRSKQGDFLQYDFLEELKNGYIFSPKYESTYKTFKTPHVLVLMNETPDMTKLSEDRYMIRTI